MKEGSLRSRDSEFSSSIVKEIFSEIPLKFSGYSSRDSIVTLMTSIFLAVVGYWLFNYSAWFAMPVTWCFLGLVMTGLNAIGYECGRGSFSKHEVINAVVGNIVCWPLLLPYETWNLQTKGKIFENRFQSLSHGSAWWLSSSWQWVKSNFGFGSIVDTQHKTQIIRSVVAQWAFSLIFFPVLFYFVGIWGVVKYWLFPWLTYHVWMSSFISNVYQVPFIDMETSGYVIMPTKYPIWLEYITHDINYVISATRSISTTVTEKIPNHKLKPVYDYMLNRMNIPESHIIHNKLAINFLYLSPLISIYGIFYSDIYTNTLHLTAILYVIGAIGHVMGYHRLFAHHSFKTNNFVKSILLFAGSSNFIGSCINWCRDHRNHHHFAGTSTDPFDIKKGVLQAHLACFKEEREYMNEEYHPNVNDLENDPLVRFQDKYYPYIATASGIIMPTLIAGFGWGDFTGGFFFSSLVRAILNMHSALAMNSLTHYFGTQKYSNKTTARDSFLLSFLTFGEGNQNFHHAYPSDYRNGAHIASFDPVRLIIKTLEVFGICWDVKRYSKNTIITSKVKLEETILEDIKRKLYWGTPLDQLPQRTWEDIKEGNKNGECLIVIDNIIYDVSGFMSLHPGGEKYLKTYKGLDATAAFNGKVYEHSNAGRNVARTLRVGILSE
eukprot:TRINITY_DN719_c0_g1_i1.p1 TRINITY_DN719_c0_g1~~TRINITY_DN719_c0_g1_i1.p1  ORF type:complete len:663 (-),score=122.68 TRINITY_DN719_c0_g1_i1:695-2683(-)